MIQRFKAAKTKKQAQAALILNVPGIFLILTLCCFCGLVIYANYSTCDPLTLGKISSPNQYITFYVLENFNQIPGMIGIFLGAIFCSSLSSLSSSQNSMSMIIWEDFMKLSPYFRKLSDKKSLTVNKLIVLIGGILCVLFTYVISLSSSNLMQLSQSLTGALNAPLLGLFLMSLFFSCSNRYGAISGVIVGFLATGWISIGAQIFSPKYPRLNVSIEACFNDSIYYNTTTDFVFTFNPEPFTGFNKIYSISYLWYTTIGILVTMISGLIVSVATGGLRNKVDRSLLIYDICSCFKFKSMSRK